MRGIAPDKLDGRVRYCVEESDQFAGRTPDAGNAKLILSNALERARLANARGEVDTIRESLAAAAAAAAAMALRTKLPDGVVTLKAQDGETHEFPPGPSGATPPAWMDGLCAALAVCDATAIEILAHPALLPVISAQAAREEATVGTEPLWEPYMHAFVALVRNDPAAAKHARLAINAMQGGSTGVLDRASLLAVDRWVCELIAVLATGKTDAWNPGVGKAIEAFHASFADESSASLTTGYLPLGVIGLCALAFDRGFGSPDDTPYIPAAIVAEKPGEGGPSIEIHIGNRDVLGADEAHWYLDLQGFAREGRAHRLQDANGALQAVYDLPAANGLPATQTRFSIVDRVEDATDLALDAGELVFLAEAFAKECNPDSTLPIAQRRELLSDAVACMDAAVIRLPADGSVLDRSAVTSECGRQVYDAEPDRFRRTRLAAYTSGLEKVLEAYDGTLAEQGGSLNGRGIQPMCSDDDARATALALSAVVRAEALIVIEALATDFDGEVLATLKPRDDDYLKVFAAGAAERAKEAYERLWSQRLNMDFPTSSHSEIKCDVAPAGMFADRNELSHAFPGGYLAIADKLEAHRVWVAWQYHRPGESAGLAYDGLVWIDDHWSWFPKPYRYLAG